MSADQVLIVAAEASSSLYAQRLLEHWKKKGADIRAFGIGSQAMEQLGFETLGRAEDMAVVGFQEVIVHWSTISQAFHRLVDEARHRRPRFALLLDYPDFNLRLAKKLKKIGIPVIYYISPQVWAWRQSRVKLIRKVVDKMLVVFPFEEEFYRERGVEVEFVGHPLLDEISDELFSVAERSKHRQSRGWSDSDLVVGLMPGSRNSELRHHLKTQLGVASKLHKAKPGLKFVVLVAPTLDHREMEKHLPPLDFPLVLIKDDPMRMVSMVDIVLCASGTATLLVGLMGKPLVVMYKMNSLTAILAKLFVRSISNFGLINLVLGKAVVPEFFQGQATEERLSTELLALIDDKKRRELMSAELCTVRQKLGNRGATVRVAAALDQYCRRS